MFSVEGSISKVMNGIVGYVSTKTFEKATYEPIRKDGMETKLCDPKIMYTMSQPIVEGLRRTLTEKVSNPQDVRDDHTCSGYFSFIIDSANRVFLFIQVGFYTVTISNYCAMHELSGYEEHEYNRPL